MSTITKTPETAGTGFQQEEHIPEKKQVNKTIIQYKPQPKKRSFYFTHTRMGKSQ